MPKGAIVPFRSKFKARYRSRTHVGAGRFTSIDWLNVLARQSFRCIDCQVHHRRSPLTVGHARPLVLNGTNRRDNIIAQCLSCNSRQGGRLHPSVGAIA